MKGTVGVAVLALGLTGGATLLLGPLIPLLFLMPPLHDAMVGVVLHLWGYFLVAVMERVYGVRFFFAGEADVGAATRSILVSNHRTRLDWFFLWCMAFKAHVGSGFRIILKSGLKNVPLMGWALQQFKFLFLARNLETDAPHINNMLRMYGTTMSKYMLLLFPEGTDLSDKNLARSDAFAEKNGLQKYRQVLHPRVKGWWLAVDALRNTLDEVYDVTLAYKGNIPQNEAALFKGFTPSEVHLLVQRVPVKELPLASEEDASEWMLARFQAKEASLARFYKDGAFPDNPSVAYHLNPIKAYFTLVLFPGLALLLFANLWWRPALTLLYCCAYVAFFVASKSLWKGLDMYIVNRFVKSHPKQE